MPQALAASGARQVVLVAAGLDSHAFRLDWPAGTRFFELDRPEVLRAKQEVLDQVVDPHAARPRCDRRRVGVDLEDGWADALTAAGFDAAAPSVWLIEGLFPYLDDAAVSAVLAQVTRLATRGSRLGADTVGRSFLESPWVRGYLDALARENAPWKFGTDQPEAFLAARGWQAVAVRPGDPPASYRRRPYPMLPRDTPGTPQTFLVTVVRD